MLYLTKLPSCTLEHLRKISFSSKFQSFCKIPDKNLSLQRQLCLLLKYMYQYLFSDRRCGWGTSKIRNGKTIKYSIYQDSVIRLTISITVNQLQFHSHIIVENCKPQKTSSKHKTCRFSLRLLFSEQSKAVFYVSCCDCILVISFVARSVLLATIL